MSKNTILSKLFGSRQKISLEQSLLEPRKTKALLGDQAIEGYLFTTIVVMTKGLNMKVNTSIPFGMFASDSKKPLEKSKNPAYRIITVAKNSGQDWKPELIKIRSCILLNGFFYVCDKIRCVMTNCMEEPSGSPRSLICGISNSVQFVTLRLETKLTASNLIKESAHV